MKAIPPPPNKKSIVPFENKAAATCSFPPSQALNIPPDFCCHKHSHLSVTRLICRPTSHLMVYCGIVDFLTGIDGQIWPAHCNSARLSNPPAGQILPLNYTLLNEAAAQSPQGVRPHPNTRTPNMVLQWGGRSGFVLLHPETL